MEAQSPRVRSFVALELSEEVRRRCAEVQARLRPVARGTKWVEPHQFHLTLKFLGDVPGEEVPAISEALSRVAAGVEPFALTLRGAGAFPNPRRARVLWVGVSEGGEQAVGVAAAVEEALAELGYPPEGKPFRPHLTLGRVREPSPSPRLEEALASLAEEECGSAPLDHLTLFASRLTPKGPIYSVISKHMYGGVL